MKAALMITLGHNSSALFYNGFNKPIGYEQERLDKIKSSSAFPSLAIRKVVDTVGEGLRGAKLFISHWFDNFDLSTIDSKYYDPIFINELVNDFDMELVLLTKDFSHHDAHAHSNRSFLNCCIDYDGSEADIEFYETVHYIVADGFGNLQEVMSIYEQTDGPYGDLKLISRVYGYQHSLGLMYQYATSFCGMKENQDEYKFLGYESLISNQHPDIIAMIDIAADLRAKHNIEQSVFRHQSYPENDYIRLGDLRTAQDMFYGLFSELLKYLDSEPKDFRTIIGYYIQRIAEKTLEGIISLHNIKHVCLSGGCFYNVKLNNHILKTVVGFVSVIPLAGDQGATIGMYDKYIGTFNFYDLCFGPRDLSGKVVTRKAINVKDYTDRITITDDRKIFVDTIVELLNNNKIVNIVNGSMEFGPRALCNTSTLAIPTKKNIDYINTLNGRNTIMPMAPVLLYSNASALFDMSTFDRVVGSNNYMIITHDFIQEASVSEKYKGVMHKYPMKDIFSGRPQVVNADDIRPIRDILRGVYSLCLINTSFNTHGTPILYSFEDCVKDFKQQCIEDVDNLNHLVILN